MLHVYLQNMFILLFSGAVLQISSTYWLIPLFTSSISCFYLTFSIRYSKRKVEVPKYNFEFGFFLFKFQLVSNLCVQFVTGLLCLGFMCVKVFIHFKLIEILGFWMHNCHHFQKNISPDFYKYSFLSCFLNIVYYSYMFVRYLNNIPLVNRGFFQSFICFSF